MWLRTDHTHIWLILLSLVLGDYMPIFFLIGHRLTFLSHNTFVVLAMTKLHLLPCLHVFNNAHLGSWSTCQISAFLVQAFSCDPRHILTNQKIYIFKCVRRSNSFGPSINQYTFVETFALHTNRKRCNQEGFHPCYSQS